MFGIISLEEISGGSFFEVLRNLILKCIPAGETLLEILSDYSIPLLIFGALAGIFQCFFGYQVRRFWTALLFIMICSSGSVYLGAKYSLSAAACVAISAGVAILGGLAGYFLWVIGCFVRPFFVITVVVFAVFAMNGLHPLGLIIALAAGLIAGIVTAAFCRICLIFYTAVLGGLLAGACILELFDAMDYTVFIVGGILALAGLGVQFFLNRERVENAELPAGAEADAEGAGRLKTVSQDGVALQDGMPSEDGMPSRDGIPSPEGVLSKDEIALLDGAAAQDGILLQDGISSKDDIALQHGMAASQLAAAQEGGVSENNTQALDVSADRESAVAGFCPSCGKPYSARAKFCMYCGQKLK